MSLREEINAIVMDDNLAYEEKKVRLLSLVTPREAEALLKKKIEIPTLKEPLPKWEQGAKTLRLPLLKVYLESVLRGGFEDERGFSEYYKKRCTYEENGKTYLKPYSALTFFCGRDSKAQWATVELLNIKVDSSGEMIMFTCGKVLETNIQ